MQYFPLHVHSHFSLLDGLSKPAQIAKRCNTLGIPGSALTDHGNIAGSVDFITAMTKANVKPIIGCELYVSPKDCTIKDGDRTLHHLVVLAKNLEGWKRLVQITSEANRPENYYYKPRIDLERLAEYVDGNLIAFSGHLGSHLSATIFQDLNSVHECQSIQDAKKLSYPDWTTRTINMAEKLRDIFGKDNFFIEIQLMDSQNVPGMKILAKGLRYISKKTGIPCIATPDAHYAEQEDAIDQRVLLANSLNTNFREISQKMVRGDDVGLSTFFTSRNYHIPSYDEMIAGGNTPEELAKTLEIADMCETYELSGPPMLPKFQCPDGLSSKGYLKKLLHEGWEKRAEQIAKGSHSEQEYKDRLNEEYKTLTDIGLADYFLIVHDIIKWAREQGQITGAGRGSAAGSVILYLLEVTHVDPLEYDLLFERFYNASRYIPQHVSFEEEPFLKHIGV